MTIEDQRLSAETVAPAELRVNDDITLELYRSEDAPVIYAAVDANRDFLARTQPGMVEGFTPETAQRFIDGMVANTQAGVSAPYKIMLHGELVGSVSYSRREGSSAVMGYWLVESAQGKGIATAAAHRLIEFGEQHWGLQKTIFEIGTENARSLRTAQRIGAKLVGPNPKDQSEEVWERLKDAA